MKKILFCHTNATQPLSTIFIWLWSQFKANRRQALLNLIIGTLVVVFQFVFVWSTKLSVDIATGANHDSSLFVAITLLLISILLQLFLSFSARWVRALLGIKAQNHLQQTIFQRVMQSEWSASEQFHSGDILNRIEKDIVVIVSFITESLPLFITCVIQFTGAFIFLFLMDRTLACLVIVLLPCFILVSRIYIKKMRTISSDIRNTESKIQSIIQENIQKRTILKALQQNESIIRELYNEQNHLSKQIKEKTHYTATSSIWVNSGFSAGYLLAFLWGIYCLVHGEISYGSLIAFIQLVAQIQAPTRNITHILPAFISSITAGERLYELERLPNEPLSQAKRLKGNLGIRIQQVSYAYPENNKPVLRQCTFDFKPGSKTALVGETGAGKTTLLRILLGLIHPQSGFATLYNKNQTVEISADTRINFSYVPQGNTLFSGTIRQNLLLGNSTASLQEMKSALRKACADFVFDFPDKLETKCGEQGYGLSEGQAQRICIARAFLQPGQILLMDEATSALDEQTELQILKNINSDESGKTFIMVSHKPAVIKYCNQRMVLLRNPAPIQK